jgi:uncharacterized iron-regulated protein
VARRGILNQLPAQLDNNNLLVEVSRWGKSMLFVGDFSESKQFNSICNCEEVLALICSVLLTWLGAKKMRLLIKKRRSRSLTYLLACALGIILFCTQSVNAQKATGVCRPQFIAPEQELSYDYEVQEGNDVCRDRVINPQAALRELAQVDVVYLGETHDRAADHQTQLQIIQEIQQRNSKLAIAMEMFQHPYQGILNRYLKGQLSEQELVEQSEYNQRWGFPWEYYAPILRFAKAKHLPILALNTPTEITRQVASAGLESLTPKQRQLIPPLSEIRTDNPEYRQLLAKTFRQHQHFSHGNSADFDRFFLAQVLWDETMAAGITKFLKANPNHQVVVLAGQGHIVYGYGIPSRVARRLKDQQVVQRSVLLSPAKDNLSNTKQVIADFIWQQQ